MVISYISIEQLFKVGNITVIFIIKFTCLHVITVKCILNVPLKII